MIGALVILYGSMAGLLLAISPLLVLRAKRRRDMTISLAGCIAALVLFAWWAGFMGRRLARDDIATGRLIYQRTASAVASLDSWIELPSFVSQRGIVYVVSTTDCPNCAAAWHSGSDLRAKGWTLRYTFYGRAQPALGSFISAYCSPRPEQSLALLFAGGKVPDASCANDFAANPRIIVAANIPADPFFVLDNGVIVSAAGRDTASLLTVLNEAHQALPPDKRLTKPLYLPTRPAPGWLADAR